MNTDPKTYQQYVKSHAPKSPLAKDCLCAFLTGGFVCALAESLTRLYAMLGASEEMKRPLVSVTLIFLATLLTGLGIFDEIARFAGAGTLVPITGFANAMAAPAIDDKSEGLIMGVGAKMFTIAGPVLVYGVLSSTVYGVIYWLCGVMK